MPNISNSSWFQPQTMLSPKRPSLTWETVTICLAAKIGCTRGACTVPNTVMRLVLARRPHAQVIVSSVLPSKSVSPPYPFQRAMGSRNSMPASSAICASFRLCSQEASQRSGTLVTAIPPEQLGEKMPNLSLLALNIVVRGFSMARNIPSLPSGSIFEKQESRIIRRAPRSGYSLLRVRKRGVLVLGDGRQGGLEHAQAFVELLVGDHQRNEDADNIVEGTGGDGDQPMLVAVARNLLGFGIGRLAALSVANQFHSAHSDRKSTRLNSSHS